MLLKKSLTKVRDKYFVQKVSPYDTYVWKFINNLRTFLLMWFFYEVAQIKKIKNLKCIHAKVACRSGDPLKIFILRRDVVLYEHFTL